MKLANKKGLIPTNTNATDKLAKVKSLPVDSRSSSFMFSITRCIQSKVFRIMVLLAFICLLVRPHALSTFNVLSGIDNSEVSEINNLRRVGTITMLYGEPDEIYDRAMRSHERYCKRRGYPMHRLSQNIFKSFWNKPYYILSILMQELAKRPSERVQWFMYVSSTIQF